MTFIATSTFSYYLLIKNLHATSYSFRDIRNGPEKPGNKVVLIPVLVLHYAHLFFF